jgi:hypothetical protein
MELIFHYGKLMKPSRANSRVNWSKISHVLRIISTSLSGLMMGTDMVYEMSVIFNNSTQLKSQKILSTLIAVISSDLDSLAIELNLHHKESFMDYTSIATFAMK